MMTGPFPSRNAAGYWGGGFLAQDMSGGWWSLHAIIRPNGVDLFAVGENGRRDGWPETLREKCVFATPDPCALTDRNKEQVMSDTAARFAPTVGTTLPRNGATILRSYQDNNDCVVLCRTLKGEFVTWRVDHEGCAVWAITSGAIICTRQSRIFSPALTSTTRSKHAHPSRSHQSYSRFDP